MNREIEFTPKVETEWISTLKKFGIIEKKDEKEENIQKDLIINKVNELNEKFEDDIDAIFDELNEDYEKEFQEYTLKRMAELKKEYNRKKFGEVIEITRENYVDEVNNAGENIWVVLHVYKPGMMLCSLINQYLSLLAIKFKTTKFIKSIVDLCIANFPEDNLPAIFIYYNGEVKKKFLGTLQIGDLNLKCDDLELILSKIGAIESNIKSELKKKRKKSKKFLQVYNNESDSDLDSN